MLEVFAAVCVLIVTADAVARMGRLMNLRHADEMTRQASAAIADGTDEEAAAALLELTRMRITAAELRRLEVYALEHGDPLVGLPLYRTIQELKARRGVDVGVAMVERAAAIEERQALELEVAIERVARDALGAERARAMLAGEQLAIDVGVMP